MALTKIPASFLDTSTHVDLLDNEKIRLGADADLQIYHSGSKSYIKDAGTGNLAILTNTLELNNAADSQNMIVVNEGGAVTLYHGGNAKLATASGGVTVTGAVTATSFSGAHTGTTATASGGTNNTALASTAFVQQELTTLIGGAPSTLNDLNELAAAINDDANYNSTLTTALATKAPLASPTFTGTPLLSNRFKSQDGSAQMNMGQWDGSNHRIEADSNRPLKIYSYNTSSGIALGISGSDKLTINGDGSGVTVAGALTAAGNITATSGFIHSNTVGSDKKYRWSRTGGKVWSLEHDASGFYFYNETDSTLHTRFLNNGNVGIGISSPAMPLSVQAASNAYAISMHGRSDGYSELYGASNDGSTKYSFLQSHSAQTKLYTLVNTPLLFGTNSTERMRISNTGNVGIGLGGGDPSDLLHLKGGTGNNSTAAPIIRLQKHSGGAVDDGHVIGGMSFWVNDDGVDSGAPKERAKIAAVSQNTSSASRLEFYTAGNTTAIEKRMTIQGDGSVGIGTSAPGRPLEVSHSSGAHIPVLRLTGSSTSGYAAGLEWYSGYGPKVSSTMFSTASGSQGGEYWQEVRNQSSNTLKRTYHISNAAKHTFYGQHNGDSTGHFLFTNQLHDAASTNCSLVVQNGYTFIQVMGWTSLGARIGTRTGGWSGNSGGDVHFTRQDAMQIKLGSSGPVLSNGTAISSDERLKKNIANVADGQLAKINALTVRTFEWKNPDSQFAGTQEGFIAQEVESVIPEAVKEEIMAPDPHDTSRDFEGDVKLLKNDVINARLIKAVQELSAKLEAAEARITTLEG